MILWLPDASSAKESSFLKKACSSEDGTLKMFVNGKENFEYENYIPKDKDDIRIEFS